MGSPYQGTTCLPNGTEGGTFVAEVVGLLTTRLAINNAEEMKFGVLVVAALPALLFLAK
jgi:hypothetical protein